MVGRSRRTMVSGMCAEVIVLWLAAACSIMSIVLSYFEPAKFHIFWSGRYVTIYSVMS